jgi:hypothetical protein
LHMADEEEKKLHLLALDTFLIDVYSTFEYAADNAIEKLEKENAKSFNLNNRLEEQQKLIENRLEDEEPLDYLLRTQESSRVMMDIVYRTEEMIALVEMKIIYAYKHLEINIKRLISLAYPEVKTKDLFKADKLHKLLISKGIDVTKFNGLKELRELRLVNNMIKHSGKIESEIKAIPEFLNYESVQFGPLHLFYERIKKTPMEFLKALNIIVVNQLYPS